MIGQENYDFKCMNAQIDFQHAGLNFRTTY